MIETTSCLPLDEALRIGEILEIDWSQYSMLEFIVGYVIELEHGTKYPRWNITNDDPIMTAKIALAHLEELPDYYTRLQKMENNLL